jgi:hypothetical protein
MIACTHNRQETMNKLFGSAALVVSLGLVSASATQNPAPTGTPLKGIAVRGCLTKSRLTHVEPVVDSDTSFPDSIGINAARVIRSQIKALNGHQVELIGTVEGVGLQKGVLVGESDKLKVYLGGSDPNLGEEFRRSGQPTFNAHTIKDIAPTCTAQAQ